MDISKNNESRIINSMFEMYACVMKISFPDCHYKLLKANEISSKVFPPEGDGAVALKIMLDNLVAFPFKKDVTDFVDLNTLEKRLLKEKCLSIEYLRPDGGWSILNFSAGDFSESGRLENFYLLVQNRYKNIERYNQELEYSKIQKDIAFALSTKYISIYHVDLDKDLYTIQQITNGLRKDVSDFAKKPQSFHQATKNYIKFFVDPEDQGFLTEVFKKQNILNHFKTETNFSVRYKVRPNPENQTYFEISFVKISNSANSNIMVLSWRCIDEVMQRELEYQRLLKLTLDDTNTMYQEILKLQTNGIIAYYADSKELITMNDAAYKIFDIDYEGSFKELQDKFRKKWDNSNGKRILQGIESLKYETEPFVFDFKVKHSAGNFVNVMAQAKLINTQFDRSVVLISLTDVTEKVQNEERLKILSETDSLTGVSNRSSGENKIQQVIDNKIEGIFCILDIDKFKMINDSYGHTTGDKVLKIIADTLVKTFCEKGFVFRLGGDEFGIFVENVKTQKDAEKLFGRFENNLEKVDFNLSGNLKITTSAGAVFKKAYDTFDSLYVKADEAMYRCKKLTDQNLSF